LKGHNLKSQINIHFNKNGVADSHKVEAKKKNNYEKI